MIVFPHIPKTGGTTVLNHFRQAKGPNEVMSLGPNSRAVRFFRGLKQIEELEESHFDSAFCLQGHGVCDVHAMLTDPDQARFMVVLREPDGHTRSRYNHRRNARLRKSGEDLTTEQFRHRYFTPDFQCSVLMQKFPHFIDEGAETILEKAVSILRKFDYVLLTERLDEQFSDIAAALDVPSELERKRTAENKVPLDISTFEVLERHQADLVLVETLRRYKGGAVDGRYNPFGYDAEGRKAAMERLETVVGRNKYKRDAKILAYDELASGFCMQMQAERALYQLRRHAGKQPIDDPKLLRKILREKWEAMEPKLTEVQREKSQRNLRKSRNVSRRKLGSVGAKSAEVNSSLVKEPQ